MSSGMDLDPRFEGSIHAADLDPNATICLTQAMYLHHLTTENFPGFQVALLEPNPEIERLEHTETFIYEPETFDIGVETVEVDGRVLRIYGPERTIIDYIRRGWEDEGWIALKNLYDERRGLGNLYSMVKNFPDVQDKISLAIRVVSAS